MSAVTNPIQACSEVFVRPRAVFEALKTRNNWSWVPFIPTAIIGSLPGICTLHQSIKIITTRY